MKAFIGVALSLLALNASAASIGGQGTWETTLLARDLDGDNTTAEAYYDTVLDITWLADANLAETQNFGISVGPNGSMNWFTAVDWIAAMNASNGGIGYLGVSNWRMPVNTNVGGTNYDTTFSSDGSTDNAYNISAPGSVYEYTTASEMAHLYYVALANTPGHNLDGTSSLCVESAYICLSNFGPFYNIENANYWSGTTGPRPFDTAWNVNFQNGQQYLHDKLNEQDYVWTVTNGDIGVSVVPIPSAVWLFGSGLISLIGLARRKT